MCHPFPFSGVNIFVWWCLGGSGLRVYDGNSLTGIAILFQTKENELLGWNTSDVFVCVCACERRREGVSAAIQRHCRGTEEKNNLCWQFWHRHVTCDVVSSHKNDSIVCILVYLNLLVSVEGGFRSALSLNVNTSSSSALQLNQLGFSFNAAAQVQLLSCVSNAAVSVHAH